jgi:hypothetical protein
MPILPHRFRETAFRRYEPYIAKIVAAYPNPVEIDPSPLSPITFSCRLRDAITSFKRYKWSSSIQFSNIDVKVCEENGKIIIKPRHTNCLPVKIILQELSTPSDQELQVVAEKLHNRVIAGPIRVKGISFSQLNKLAEFYDIELIQEKDCIILL